MRPARTCKSADERRNARFSIGHIALLALESFKEALAALFQRAIALIELTAQCSQSARSATTAANGQTNEHILPQRRRTDLLHGFQQLFARRAAQRSCVDAQFAARLVGLGWRGSERRKVGTRPVAVHQRWRVALERGNALRDGVA